MGIWEALAIFAAGMAAGTINTIVGSGTLITFPTLLAFGFGSVTANVSNTLGLVAGGISGTLGYREELRGKGAHLKQIAPFSLIGAIVGAVLLLVLPSSAFDAVVPLLIAVGVLLVAAGPWLNKRAAKAHEATVGHAVTGGRLIALGVGVFLAGVYGGYFGAAQGIILMGLMSVLLPIPLQEINAIKNVLGTIVNGVAAVTFLVVSPEHIDWTVAVLIALGALCGGVIGARVGRRLHPWVLRGFIIVMGVVAIVNLLR